MRSDGHAGAEKPAGEVGEICFRGEQVFLGYLGDEAATHKTISRDGYLYTGDLGSYDEKGLHLSGRSKLVIKPKGYQVFPGEVESFIAEQLRDRVQQVAVVGVPHEIFSEGIIAFVELSAGNEDEVTDQEVKQASQGLAAYKRPAHVVILKPGELPINRVAKVDYLVLQRRASEIVHELRSRGGWDAEV